jgi:hypothetical protein
MTAALCRKVGEGMVLDSNRDANMIEDLLDLQEKMEEVLKRSFGNQVCEEKVTNFRLVSTFAFKGRIPTNAQEFVREFY